MSKSIAIVGGGIAGLAAGCYARMNGYEAELLEAHTLPGGLCTSWQRKGFTIDGCIHWLVGSGEGTDFHTFWRELGVFPGTRIIDHEVFARFVGRDNRVFSLYVDADRLEAHLRELSPADGSRSPGVVRSNPAVLEVLPAHGQGLRDHGVPGFRRNARPPRPVSEAHERPGQRNHRLLGQGLARSAPAAGLAAGSAERSLPTCRRWC